jgi:hypothetical protein
VLLIAQLPALLVLANATPIVAAWILRTVRFTNNCELQEEELSRRLLIL